MKKLLLAAIVFVLTAFVIGHSKAQSGGASVQASAGAPSGTCQNAQVDIDTTAGNLWTCKAGVWTITALPGSVPLRGTTGTITGTLLVVGGCNTGTATVTGATTGMEVSASPVSDPGTGVVWNAWVSSANTVTVKECALVSLTPNNTAYNVTVNP